MNFFYFYLFSFCFYYFIYIIKFVIKWHQYKYF